MVSQAQLRQAQLSSSQASIRNRSLQEQTKKSQPQYQTVTTYQTVISPEEQERQKEINKNISSIQSELQTLQRQAEELQRTPNFSKVKSEFNSVANKIQSLYQSLNTYEKLGKQGYGAGQIANIVERANVQVQSQIASTTSGQRYIKQQDVGGYYVDPKTGYGISSVQDLTKKGYVRTATPKEIQSGSTTVKGNVVYGTSTIKTAEPHVKKIQQEVYTSKDLPVSKKTIDLNKVLTTSSYGTSSILSGVSDGVSKGNNRSVLDRVANFITGGDSFEKGSKEGLSKAKETYSAQLGVFVSASPTGESATAYFRQPTVEEKKEIEEAEKKGSFSELPPIKFLSGGYDWQKKIETKLAEKKEEGTPDWFSNLPQGDLKDIPYSPQALAPKTTNLFFKSTNAITKGAEIFGFDTSKWKEVKIPKKTAEEVALLVSLSIFDPFMRTGVVAKKKTVSQQLSKNRFSDLGTGLSEESISKVQNFYQSVRQEIVKKKAGEEQLKSLEKIYKTFFKGKPQGKENFKILVQNLYESGDFKGVPLDYLAKPKKEQLDIVVDIQGLPQMGGSSIISSGISVKSQEPINLFSVVPEEKQQLQNTLGSNQFEVLGEKTTSKNQLTTMTGLTLLSKQTTQSKQILKQQGLTKQIPKQIELLKTSQLTRQKESQLSRQQLRESLQLKQKSKLKLTTKQMSLNKFKFLLPRLGRNGGVKERIKIKEGEFTIFGKRFGKEITLGKAKTKEKAEDILKGFLSGTLGASGKIKEGERLLKAEEISLLGKEGFRKSKLSPFAVVEIKERRLKKGTQEIPEIQTFRRKSRKKSLFGFY